MLLDLSHHNLLILSLWVYVLLSSFGGHLCQWVFFIFIFMLFFDDCGLFFLLNYWLRGSLILLALLAGLSWSELSALPASSRGAYQTHDAIIQWIRLQKCWVQLFRRWGCRVSRVNFFWSSSATTNNLIDDRVETWTISIERRVRQEFFLSPRDLIQLLDTLPRLLHCIMNLSLRDLFWQYEFAIRRGYLLVFDLILRSCC
jgi:hypothetical protein